MSMISSLLCILISMAKNYQLGSDPTSSSELITKQAETYHHFEALLSTLPGVDGCCFAKVHRHADGWYASMRILIGTMVFQQLFQARPSDIFLASIPKAGTTWLKALLFATINRNSSVTTTHPFSNLTPHQRILSLEIQAYASDPTCNIDLDSLSSPRLFATHVPFHSLPKSIADSRCRIVYLSRNPKDNFVSLWHFVNKIRIDGGVEPIPIEAAVRMFCDGFSMYGPYWDHVVGYWNASRDERFKDVILFMRYEEWKEDPVSELKRLADFVGCGFTKEEEEGGVVEGIVRQCGYENLKGLEVHKPGSVIKSGIGQIENSTFFRKGEVGDWVNHLTPEMARQIDEITERRFAGSGLSTV